jgi:hypothetical protein
MPGSAETQEPPVPEDHRAPLLQQVALSSTNFTNGYIRMGKIF